MRRIGIVIAVFGVALLVGCGTNAAGAGALGASSLDGTRWRLSGIDGGAGVAAPVAGRGDLGWSFAGGSLAGSAGCNQLGGSYTQQGETISVGALRSTKMGCPEPLMGQERAVSAILMAAERAVVDADTLTISAADGRRLVFERVSA